MDLTLLLDLDDTLLENDVNRFLPAYLKALANRLSAHASADQLIPVLLAATRRMVQNDRPDCTLEQVFDADFFPRLGVLREEIQPVLDQFYRQDFPALQELTQVRPEAQAFVQGALSRGLRIGIATNPLFPKTAIQQRLAWAGLPDDQYPFELVSSYETFHFSKPNPAFYAEFLARLGWPDGQILVIGDDPGNDIQPARLLGLPVFWMNGLKSTSWSAETPEPPHGSFKDLDRWIQTSDPDSLKPDFASSASLMAILRATPAAISSLCRSLEAAQWQARPQPEEWCPVEIVCHLLDVDAEVNLPRVRRVLQEDNPFISGRDTDRWAEERAYICQDGPRSLDNFLATRIELLELLADMPQDAWDRPARHAIFGPTQLNELISIIAAHDRLHVRQIYRALHFKV